MVDFLITGGLCYYLRKNRTGAGEYGCISVNISVPFTNRLHRFDHVLDSVTLYTVENGLLTSCVTHVP